jgi:transcriptional regulator with XRE-family HTH domain
MKDGRLLDMPQHDRKDEELARILATNLRRARLRAKLHQRQVAATLDTDAMQISRWENGDITPRAVTLARLAQLYGIPIDILFVPNHPLLPDITDGEAALPSPPRVSPRSSKSKISKPH